MPALLMSTSRESQDSDEGVRYLAVQELASLEPEQLTALERKSLELVDNFLQLMG